MLQQHHRSQAQAILFYAFDVIIHRGRRLVHMPLENRRELLSGIAADLKKRTPLIGLSDMLDTTPAELIALVKEFGFEGIIAKREDSCYDPASAAVQGSSTRWPRRRHSSSAYTPNNPLDALIVG